MKFIILFLLLFVYYGQTGKYYMKLDYRHHLDYFNYLEKFSEEKHDENNYYNLYHDPNFLRKRMENYEKAKEMIDAHNENFELGLVTFSRRLTQFSDWSPENKTKRLCGTRMQPTVRTLSNSQYIKTIKSWPKLEVKQVNNCNFPNPVVDQKTCGCCWAYSTVTVVEAALLKKRGINTKLSIQQLIDCDTTNDACDGGWPTTAINYIGRNGLTSENEYTYMNKKGQCRILGKKINLPKQFVVKPMELDFKGDEESLRKLLHRIGIPVVVAAHANDAFMSAYTGRYRNESCPKNEPNHAMVLCGFGQEKDGTHYWSIRNSWSANWGENGYIRIEANNTCGIANFAIYPVLVGVKELDPFQQDVFDKPVRVLDRRRRD